MSWKLIRNLLQSLSNWTARWLSIGRMRKKAKKGNFFATMMWFLLSVGVLSAVLIRVAFPLPDGEWRGELAGTAVGDLPLVDYSGKEIKIQHPALIYFFRMACDPCKRSAPILARFVSESTEEMPSVYAITIDRISLDDQSRQAGPQNLQIVRLSRGAQQLAFVNQVPLFVMTDSVGVIKNAYVGVPGPDVLESLL